MSYIEITDAMVDVDSGLDEDLYEYMRDNIRALRTFNIWLNVTEQSHSNAAYTTLFSFLIYIPNVAGFTGLTRSIKVMIETKVSTGTGYYQLEDDASSDVSNEVSEDGTTYADLGLLTLTVDASWIGTTRTINVQGKHAAGTVYARALLRDDARLEY